MTESKKISDGANEKKIVQPASARQADLLHSAHKRTESPDLSQFPPRGTIQAPPLKHDSQDPDDQSYSLRSPMGIPYSNTDAGNGTASKRKTVVGSPAKEVQATPSTLKNAEMPSEPTPRKSAMTPPPSSLPTFPQTGSSSSPSKLPTLNNLNNTAQNDHEYDDRTAFGNGGTLFLKQAHENTALGETNAQNRRQSSENVPAPVQSASNAKSTANDNDSSQIPPIRAIARQTPSDSSLPLPPRSPLNQSGLTPAQNRSPLNQSGLNPAQNRSPLNQSGLNPAQNRSPLNQSGLNPAQNRSPLNQSGLNPAQNRSPLNQSGLNPAQNRSPLNQSGLNPAQNRSASDDKNGAPVTNAPLSPSAPASPRIDKNQGSNSSGEIPKLHPQSAPVMPISSDAKTNAISLDISSQNSALLDSENMEASVFEEENTAKRKMPQPSNSATPSIDANAVKPPSPPSKPSYPEDIPDNWMPGKQNPPEKETLFSSPQTIPEFRSPQFAPNESANNVHLEKNESLPEELEDIIAGYDDEICQVRTRDGARECSIQLCIARILEHTGYEKLAYVRYLKALEANHVSRTAIHELRRIARAYNKPKDVVTLLQSAIDTAVSAEEQSIYLEECGLIVYFSEPPQRENGIAMLCRAIALAPKRISAHLALLQLFMFEQRFNDCCDVLEKLTAITDNHQAKVLCHTLLGDIQSSLNPGKNAGLNEYLQILDIEPDSLYAFQHAMGILLRQKAYHDFYKHCVAFAQATKDKTLAHGVLVLAGAVAFDILADTDGAAQALKQAAKSRPNDTFPLELLLEHYTSDPEQWQECDHIMEELLKYAATPKERTEIMLMRALNADIHGNATLMACDFLQTLCNEGVTNPIVLNYYCLLLRKTDDVETALQIRKRILAQANTEEASSRFAHLGCFCLEVLKKNDEAETCFRSALAIDPNQRIAFENLEFLLRTRNDFNGLLQIYLARLDVVLNARLRASILHTLASICYYNLNQYENAILYYKQYLEIFPDDIHAIHCLQQIYTCTKDWKGLIDAYILEKNTHSSPAIRSELLLQIASICYYKLNKPNHAFQFLMQAKDETPKSIAVFRDILRILNQTQDWKTYVLISKELLAIQKQANDRVVTLFNMASIFEFKLCDTKSAVDCYEQILELTPDDAIAFTRLSNIYQNTNNQTAYYDLMLKYAQRLPSSPERTRLLFKVGLKTFTKFRDTERAISILEMAAAFDKTYLPLVSLLSLLYAATAKIEPLIALLQDFTNVTREQSTKSSCAITIAYLKTWIQKSPQDAIHPLELSLALAPEATNVGYMLILAQYNRGMYSELPPLFTERAQNTSDRDFAVFFYNMSAFLAHRFPVQPDLPDGEISALKAALALDPDNIIANERLEAMEPCRANLVPFLQKRLKYAPPEDKAEIQLAIAESLFNEQPQKTFSMICKLVEENPSHLPAIRIATNMAAKLNNDNLLCHFMALQAQNLENISMRVIAWSNAGAIACEKLHQNDKAIEYYKQAFMLAPQQMDLYNQLLSLLRQKHDVAAIDAIMQIHTRSLSRENQIIRYAEMADIYLKDFNNPTQAATKLRQIIDIEHDNIPALQKLAQIELNAHHYVEAQNALQCIIDIENVDPQTLLDSRKKLAQLFLERLNLPDRALPLLQQVLAQTPDDLDAIEKMADIYLMQSRSNEALALLLRLKNRIQPPRCIKILLQIASIYQSLDENEKLTQIMRELAQLVKTIPETLDNVDKWIDKSHSPSIILAFVEKLLETKDVPNDLLVAIYEFAAKTYAGPLHMRFEADKYAIAAANLAPQSFKTQLLASKVFSPKDAMTYAAAAAKLSPFTPEAYRSMLNIANNAGRPDLQARVEQQLEILDPEFKPTQKLQELYAQRRPKRAGIIDEEIIQFATTQLFNVNIQKLLKLSDDYAKIFTLQEISVTPASSHPDYVAMINEIATAMGITPPDLFFCQCEHFIYSSKPKTRNSLVFNTLALSRASKPECLFHMASALLNCKLGTLPLVMFPADNIAMLISGLLGLYNEKLTSPDILSRIKSFIPRNIRRNIADFIAQNGIQSFRYDPAQLQCAVATLDTNIGHLFSLDLKSSIAAIVRRRNPTIQLPPTPAQWFLSNTGIPQIQSLLEFNISERYSEIRQKLGLFIKVSDES